MSLPAVKQVVDQLCSEGQLYSTIDDVHHKPTEMS